MSRAITSDATWTEPGHRPRGWQIVINQHEADSRAAVLDRAPPTTFHDVLRLTAGPTARFITRHCRAIAAAVRAYKEIAK